METLSNKPSTFPSRYKCRDGSSVLRRFIRLLARLQDMLTGESASDEFCSIIRLRTKFILQRIIRLRWIIRLWYKLGHYLVHKCCVLLWQSLHVIWTCSCTVQYCGQGTCISIVLSSCSADMFMHILKL